MEPISSGNLAIWNLAAATQPRGRVLMIHGLSEHSGRHLNTVNWLHQHGWDVVRFDLRGAGRSGGKRQYVDSFQDYIDDTIHVFNWIQRELPPLPLFVLGHSLGGAIAIYFSSQYHALLQGLVLSAPAYLVGGGISPMKIKIGQWLAAIAPNLRLPKSTASEGISRDKQVIAAYEQDPLSCHFNTLRQGDEILKALPQVPSKAALIQTPTLIVHGAADPIIRVEGSYEILKALPSKNKDLFVLPHCRHELHNELDEDRLSYFQHLETWLSQHIA